MVDFVATFIAIKDGVAHGMRYSQPVRGIVGVATAVAPALYRTGAKHDAIRKEQGTSRASLRRTCLGSGGCGKLPNPDGRKGVPNEASRKCRCPYCCWRGYRWHVHGFGGGRVAMDSCRCLADVCGRQCHHVGSCRIRYFQKRMTQASSEMVSLQPGTVWCSES